MALSEGSSQGRLNSREDARSKPTYNITAPTPTLNGRLLHTAYIRHAKFSYWPYVLFNLLPMHLTAVANHPTCVQTSEAS